MAEAPPWWTSTVIYQVYPRSFADSNGDGIGDLAGVTAHLDHLVDLGVDTVWLSPFFDSPQHDVGYDVRDYRDVAPEYGTLDDAQELIDQAHDKGLKVMFDLVLNHTSEEHPWFVESRRSRDNPKADWYVWADGYRDRRGRPKPPNNWRSELQLPKAWQWCEERQQWYLATFLWFQPDLNWRNPELRAEMFDMVRMWLGRGVDGFRLDIFGSIMHDEALRDNDPKPAWINGMPRVQTPTRTMNTDENFGVAADLRAVCDEFDGDDRVLIGEVFGPPSVLRRYIEDKGRPGLHLVFLFEFLSSPYSARRYRHLIERFEREFPAPLVPTYVVENHDRTRSLSRLGGDLAKARVLATLLCTLRGVPTLYQGQEIGMENTYIPLAEANDPIPSVVAKRLPEWLNQKLPERLNRDEVRTPMQWTGEPGAGFTDAGTTPWLPIHPGHRRVNVAAQQDDPASLLNWYKALLALRRLTPALQHGELALASDVPADVIRYERTLGGATVSVVANLGDRPVSVPLTNAVLGGRSVAVLLASDPAAAVSGHLAELPANSAVVASIG
jgi:alpha-glucosidase